MGQGFFDEKSDYYSLGVTLGSLYEGHFVYEGMNAAMITVAVHDLKIIPAAAQLYQTNLTDCQCILLTVLSAHVLQHPCPGGNGGTLWRICWIPAM